MSGKKLPENIIETTNYSCDSKQLQWCVKHSQKITSSESGGCTQQTDSTGRKIVVGSCYICHQGVYKKRKKTRKLCKKCNKPVCDEPSKAITKCDSCFQE
ncbi:hypothetical protein PV328_000703 [Microctonus aethiopoides]|uniref:Uncharacterized protein n=1 Tax=Microctonus aethiopoides TaxID=144406 RepID=A0AA39FWN2_9HYME|nr:hypothetical protein PV328_000703 [Microctonus aethiopoides]